MMSWRRIAIRATAVAVATVASMLPVSHADAQTDPTAPPSTAGTIPVTTPAGPGDEVIHSWALMPGADDSRNSLTYVADPGSTIQDEVTIYNFSNVQLTFALYGTDAFNNASGQVDYLAADQAPTDVGSWVDLAQDVVTVPPGQQVTVPFTLTIPSSAVPGDHTGAVLAANRAVDEQAAANIAVDRRIGPPILLRVNGPLRTELAISGLEASYQPSINPFGGSVRVTYRIENRGNVRVGGSHSVQVSGPAGFSKRRLAPSEFPEILPGQSITYSDVVKGVSALGVITSKVEVVPASAADAAVASVTGSATSFAPPLLPLFVLAVLLGLMARRSYRRRRDHHLGDHTPDDGDGDDAEYDVDPREAQPQWS